MFGGGRKRTESTRESELIRDEAVDDELADGGEDVSDDIDELIGADLLELVDGDPEDEWTAFDLSRDWRDDGPFDIDEVDLSADEVKRVDLSAVIITPEKGMVIKLLSNPETNQVLHLMVDIAPKTAVQVTVFAAPAGEEYRGQIRQNIVDHTENAKIIEMGKGPFGTEVRRVINVTDDQGRQGIAAMRDWLIAGPRWVLDVRLLGQAALDSAESPTSLLVEEFVRNMIVRRGSVAMVPGAILPLSAPKQATAHSE